jgi:hypothetical protein
VLVVCLLTVPRGAAAEWHITPMIGVTFAGRTTLIDPQLAASKRHVNLGGALSLFGAGVFGAETIVTITPRFFQTDRTPLDSAVGRVEIDSSRTVSWMANAVLTTPRRWTEYSLRPFVSAGLGVLHASETPRADDRGLPVSATMAGFNVGGGAIGFLTKRTGVRFDLRYSSTLRGTDQGLMAIGPARLHYLSASVGLVMRR